MTRRRVLVALAFLGVVVITAGSYWFEPWRLFTTREVDERLPTVAATAASATPSPGSSPAATAAPAEPVDLVRGRFVSHEHGTSGTVRIVRQPDGQRLLAIEDLDTSDGPDLHVWITDAPVVEGHDGWRVFDDGRYVDLGELRGNVGNLVYELPDELDLADYRSVSIWCERFSVSFGAAELMQV